MEIGDSLAIDQLMKESASLGKLLKRRTIKEKEEVVEHISVEGGEAKPGAGKLQESFGHGMLVQLTPPQLCSRLSTTHFNLEV